MSSFKRFTSPIVGKVFNNNWLGLTGYVSIVFLVLFNVVYAGPGQGEVELKNPLAFDTVEGLLTAILNVVIVLAVPIIVFFIIYAGFLYVTARGNADQVKTATRALTYAIIGGVIILGAVVLAEIIGNVVGKFQAEG